jgi:hypothetical protein
MPGGFNDVAGVQGFEPRSYGPEPHVLPLDDTPEGPRRGRDYTNKPTTVNHTEDSVILNSQFLILNSHPPPE